MGSPLLVVFATGFLTTMTLIAAIGAQNAFVLRQGLRGEHVLAICLACAVSDAVLILAGVSGFARLCEQLPWLEPAMRYAGAAFLFAYGLRSFAAAQRAGGATLVPANAAPATLQATLATCLALTWLNPHVYLDTVVLLGSVSTRYHDHRIAFALGAITSSFLFFFSLGYGARLLRPLFANPKAWRILDAGIGVTMAALAAKLVLES